MTYTEDHIQYCTTKVIRSDMKSLMKDYLNIQITGAKALIMYNYYIVYLNLDPVMHFSMHIDVYLLK